MKDSGTGNYIVQSVKCVIRCVPKNTEPGKLDVGTLSDTKNTFEVDYIKISIDGEERVELDKYNYICKIDGVDYLSEVREALCL